MLRPNDKIKIVSMVGARPNFVKIASFICALESQPGVRSILADTGLACDLKSGCCHDLWDGRTGERKVSLLISYLKKAA